MPGANRLLVTEIDGKILSLKKAPDVDQADLVGDLHELAGGTVSLFSATLHPEFADNHYLYVCYFHPGDGGHVRVSRLTLSNQRAPRIVLGSEQVVIRWHSQGHNGGCLQFGVDGFLYISTGDGSGPNPPDGRTTGQDISDLLGAILRIDVNGMDGTRNYVVPADNPFRETTGVRPEIWAYGLRNPWKFGIDRETGDLFAADNGWETWEMVHHIQRGGNCGWPIMEGRALLRGEVAPGPTPIIPPIKDHPHTEANSVIGGPVYRGDRFSELRGSFIYGDYITGTIWSIAPEEGNEYSHQTLVDTDLRIVAFTEGSGGEVYVLDHDFTGQIYELSADVRADTSADFPRRLSETGLFASLSDLQPATGVLPYEVRAARWLDGAMAQRWIAIPGDGTIVFSEDKTRAASYPNGTVFVKHLSLPANAGRPPLHLETQLLHFEDGRWYPYSYRWDDDGREAHLVDSVGADRALQVNDTATDAGVTERTWHVGAHNECRLCHNAGSRYVLGFVPRQLDRSVESAAGGRLAQLAVLAEQEVIAKQPASARNATRLVDPHDLSQSLDDRARSYLHANCAMCHHPGGNAIVSFYLHRDLPFDGLKTNKGTGIGTFGLEDAKLIVPGDPYRSVLLYRMAKLGYGRMPYIGSRVVDGRGVALIEQWIRSLDGDAATYTSPPLVAGSAEDKALRTLDQQNASSSQREHAIRDLLASTAGALALVTRMHEGELTRPDSQTAMNLGSEAQSDIRGLIDTFIPEPQRRPTLGPNVQPETILDLAGDADRGKLIFFSDNARCRTCHQLDDADASLGPTLTEITKKYPRRADLLQHTLQPSLKVDEKFAAYVVTTADGRVLNGLLIEQNDDAVVLKTPQQRLVRIGRAEMDDLQKGQKSLMPAGIVSDLTAQEAADLLEYLMGVK
jgi:putative heme-binding domain-containing protein